MGISSFTNEVRGGTAALFAVAALHLSPLNPNSVTPEISPTAVYDKANGAFGRIDNDLKRLEGARTESVRRISAVTELEQKESPDQKDGISSLRTAFAGKPKYEISSQSISYGYDPARAVLMAQREHLGAVMESTNRAVAQGPVFRPNFT